MRSSIVSGVFLSVVLLCGAASAQDFPLNRGLQATKPENIRLGAYLPRPPWSAIGRVNRRPGGFCSGTLITRIKVLTPAHCVWNRSRKVWIPSEDLHFLAGYHLGKYVEHRRIAYVELADNVDITRRGYPRNPKNDWAVLTLDRAISANASIHPIARLRSRRIKPSKLGPLVRAGYSPYRPYALSSNSCRAVGMFGRSLLMHSCDATFADSGHPILVQTRQGWRLLGLQTVTHKKNKKMNGLGMAVLVSAIPERLTR